MTDHLSTFRRQFKLDPKADLRNVQIAVEAVYEAQAIGYAFLSEVDPPSAKHGFRIHAFLNLMSRIYEQAQAMLVALATGSAASSEALGRIVVEGSINLMYLATLGNASTLVAFLESWVQEHNKKLIEWEKRIRQGVDASAVQNMIAARQEAMGSYGQYLGIIKDQCGIETALGLYVWPTTMLKRFEALGKESDYFESYHRLSGSSHITGEDTLNLLMALSVGEEHAQEMAAEAWAYSTMMSRLVCTFYVEAVAACVIAYGRTGNEDLSKLRQALAKGVHDIAKAAGVPQTT